MYRSLLTLSSAQILALTTTPVLIAPAPGALLVSVPYRVFCKLHHGGTDYAAGADLELYLGPIANNIKGVFALGTLVRSSTDKCSGTLMDLLGAALFAPALVQNQPLYLSNAGAAFTTGNGTLTVMLTYEVARTQ